jgi:hypothetical protein
MKDLLSIADLAPGPRSLVFDQAGNRLCMAQAVVWALVLLQLAGAVELTEVS